MPRKPTIRQCYTTLVTCYRNADGQLRFGATIVNEKTHTIERTHHTDFATFGEAFVQAAFILETEFNNGSW